MELKSTSGMSREEFISQHVAANQPCIIKHTDFDPNAWTPQSFGRIAGDLPVQIYDALFDLQDIDTLSGYLDKYFGKTLPAHQKVPYVRWYNRLKDVDFAWGDEAFERMSPFWSLSACVPQNDFLVPICSSDAQVNPVTDLFPYRGLLVAACGARTRLHRDPFCSDAIVNQFYGVKEFALYKPERTQELTKRKDGSSFGGFIDIREDSGRPSIAPDYAGIIAPGEMLFIPHGWLHDVLVVEDSLSITWNFVHRSGAAQYLDYLAADAEDDREFEILQYFFSLSGHTVSSGAQALNSIYGIEVPVSA